MGHCGEVGRRQRRWLLSVDVGGGKGSLLSATNPELGCLSLTGESDEGSRDDFVLHGLIVICL